MPPSDTASRRWTAAVILTTLALALAFAGLNVWIDAFGLYGDASGREMPVHYNGRVTKYLYGMNYIPANFSGLLLGSSITENWDTSRLDGARVYNASFAGSNVSEQALVAQNVFAQRHLDVVIIVVFPYMTATHGARDASMSPDAFWSGLGSVPLLRTYALMGLERFAGRLPESDAYGVAASQPVFDGGGHASVERTPEVRDEAAWSDFVVLVEHAHRDADRVIALIPPTPATAGSAYTAFLDQFDRDALAAFAPGDTVVDFNRSEYAAFREDATHYPDGAHLSEQAAALLVAELARALAHPDSAATAADYAVGAAHPYSP